MNNESYFYTWAAQSDFKSLDVVGTKDTKILLKSGLELDDFTSTSFQTSFGHSARNIQDTIAKQLYEMPIAGPTWHTQLKEQQSQRLLDLLKLKGKIFYTSGGAEAVENALKIARQVSGKQIVLARTKSYHGATLGALSITGDWRNAEHKTITDWTVRIPEPIDDPDLVETQKIIASIGANKIAAICLETITGTNGVYIPEQKWFDKVQKLCLENKIFLICDEVLVGFGRAGATFAFHKYNLKPDFVTLSKGITGGYVPFGAVYVSQAISAHYDHKVLSCGLTSYAHPLGLAAMSAVIDYFHDNQFCDHLGELESLFAQKLDQIRKYKKIKEIRVAGLLAALEFDSDKVLQNKAIFVKHGLYVFASKAMLILAPPLTYKKNEFASALERLQLAVQELVEVL